MGKAALLSPVQVARLCPTPGPADSQTSPTRPGRWFWALSHYQGNRVTGTKGSDGQGQGRSPARPHRGGGPYALGPTCRPRGLPWTEGKSGRRGAAGPPAWAWPPRAARFVQAAAPLRDSVCLSEMWLKIDLQVTVRMERQNSSRTFFSIRETGDSP